MTRSVNATTLGMLVLLIAGLVWSAATRAYNPDEFQHVQMAWLIAEGQIPNRDFFEHHTYLWHLLAAPWLSDPRLTREGDAAVAALLHLRYSGIALAALAIVLTERLGRELLDPLTARLGALALACSAIFLMLALEIRPDQLALCLLLVMSIALVRIRTTARVWFWALLAGAAAALTVLTTQKIIFAAPGLIVGLAVALWLRGGGLRPAMVATGAASVGALAVIGPFASWLISNAALDAFVHENFLLGAVWHRELRSMILILTDALRDETFLFALAALGGLAVTVGSGRDAVWRWSILAPMVSLIVLMPAFPVVQRQYLLLALPYASLLAGFGLTRLIDWIDGPRFARVAGGAILVGGVTLHGALALKTQQTAKDDTALRVLRAVVEQTPPDATILRSWSPGMAFRKPAFRYFSLHPEIDALVTPAEWITLAEGLNTGRAAPAAIEMDRFMRTKPPVLVAAIERGWQPSGVGDLWVRKPTASTATAPGPPPSRSPTPIGSYSRPATP